MAMEFVKAEMVPYNDFPIPETLYKYRDWHDKYHRRAITHREVFFASPASFEDKLDCKNPLRYDLLTDEDILNKCFNDTKKTKPYWTVEQQMEFAINWANDNPMRDKEHIARIQKQQQDDFNDKAGVLSLTEHPGELRMWEKYSASHTGFCIGFDPKTMLYGIASGGGIVLYNEELPIIYPSPKHSYIEQSILQIFNKLDGWSYEKEYRAYFFKYHKPTDKQRTITVHPTTVKEIILGAKMSKKDEQLLLKSIPKELSHVKMRRAVTNGDNIEIQDVVQPI